jgi:hypothetical protein
MIRDRRSGRGEQEQQRAQDPIAPDGVRRGLLGAARCWARSITRHAANTVNTSRQYKISPVVRG